MKNQVKRLGQFLNEDNTGMKKFCVLFLSQEDWEAPGVVFVDAESEDAAYLLALEKVGYTEEEVEAMLDEGDYSIDIKEVE
ncbi:hypothetical protein UFOVP699_148 [uncultured Caudovirales phage]|uniref:Uncharacterized protein n=1 Tax=uncultured Caudovirales phage TaxID=2100421 RepID=A0A6J5NL27_9CAUD|nr:hypothetical protein UFOVP699_148 [uncultured Caudovirales phage]